MIAATVIEARAVILDRYPLWLRAVEAVVTSIGVRVVGKATSTAKAIELLAEHECEILIADLNTVEAGTDPIAFLREVISRFGHLKIVILSDDDPQLILGALNAGAVAFVVKTAHPDDLATAIRQLFEHSIYMRDLRVTIPMAHSVADAHPELTPRELEILRLVAEGHSNAELGKILWVTEQTVKFHLSNIYRKLGVANRTEASRWAQMHDLLPKAAGPDVLSDLGRRTQLRAARVASIQDQTTEERATAAGAAS